LRVGEGRHDGRRIGPLMRSAGRTIESSPASSIARGLVAASKSSTISSSAGPVTLSKSPLTSRGNNEVFARPRRGGLEPPFKPAALQT
jgi:hypothetical protein